MNVFLPFWLYLSKFTLDPPFLNMLLLLVIVFFFMLYLCLLVLLLLFVSVFLHVFSVVRQRIKKYKKKRVSAFPFDSPYKCGARFHIIW